MGGKQSVASRLDKWLYTSGLRSASGLTLPRFLGIGAQKSGTTWLHTNLRQHPGLFLPETKELHYFDRGFDRSLASYAAQFAAATGRQAGEITPAYSLLSERRVHFIRQIMPDLRVVLLVRNPVDRAWAHAVMRLVKRLRHDPAELSDADFIKHLRSRRSIARGSYSRIIGRWEAAFGRQALLVGFFEEILEEPVALLSRIFDHLGVSKDVDWSDFPYAQVVLRGEPVALRESLRETLIDMYREELDLLELRFGAPVTRWKQQLGLA